MPTEGLSLDAIDTRACTLPTALHEPLVAAGGVFQPLLQHSWTSLAPSAFSILALAKDHAQWIDTSCAEAAAHRRTECGDRAAGSARTLYAPGEILVGALPTDDSNLLLLTERRARWLEFPLQLIRLYQHLVSI